MTDPKDTLIEAQRLYIEYLEDAIVNGRESFEENACKIMIAAAEKAVKKVNG